MPCDTIQESTVTLTNPNMKLLMDALTKLNLRPTLTHEGTRIRFSKGTFQNGEITTTGYDSEELGEKIKTEYSASILGYAAKQFGWKLEQQAQNKNRPGVKLTYRATKR